MNEFIEQFLIESRELIEQATDGLLALEQAPQNAERLDAVFRALHTLKGGAGIVDFTAMERAVHAAEDVLSNARSGKRSLTATSVGDCLACLDQVEQWLDELQRTGELPAHGDAQADSVINRFRKSDVSVETGTGTGSTDARKNAADRGWVADTLSRNSHVRSRAQTAIQFIPDSDCFFQGEDPLARILSVPELLCLDVEPLTAWAPLNALDPYKCNLVLTALTARPADEVAAHLKGHTGTCELRPVIAAPTADAESSLPPRARDVLQAQLALLEHTSAANFVGRIASAGVVAANVLRFCGRIGHAELLAIAAERSLHEHHAESLREAIAQAIATTRTVDVAEVVEPQATPELATRTLRVDAERVDALVRLTGELTVAKNSIGHVLKLAQARGDSTAPLLKERHAVLEHLVAELQRSVLGMRVLPLRTVLQRFPRVLRDLSASLGKLVTLRIAGDDTEADKAIVEMLFEPLLHLLRNALDHGIESPAARAELGKPAVATIEIRALRRSDQVLIEVSDDGAGIDVARVREVAASRGIADEETLRSMPDADVIDLIFAPGFSTAATVTGLSGRGVGMDAVRSAVERVGGRVAVESRKNRGTTVRFSLPFSVMMTHVMTVEAGGQAFGIPLESVVETARVARENIAQVGAARAFVLRNRTVPVIELRSVLGVGGSAGVEGDDAAEATIVVTSFAGQLGGIRVDRIGERLEVILKPLDGLLAGLAGISGTTMLGDGQVLLVLDIGELLR